MREVFATATAAPTADVIDEIMLANDLLHGAPSLCELATTSDFGLNVLLNDYSERMSGRSADVHQVRLWHRNGMDAGYRDLGIIDVTVSKGYLVDLAGEILFTRKRKPSARSSTKFPASTGSSQCKRGILASLTLGPDEASGPIAWCAGLLQSQFRKLAPEATCFVFGFEADLKSKAAGDDHGFETCRLNTLSI
jgi:hypothetical protein